MQGRVVHAVPDRLRTRPGPASTGPTESSLHYEAPLAAPNHRAVSSAFTPSGWPAGGLNTGRGGAPQHRSGAGTKEDEPSKIRLTESPVWQDRQSVITMAASYSSWSGRGGIGPAVDVGGRRDGSHRRAETPQRR